jgi:hypothetical protein
LSDILQMEASVRERLLPLAAICKTEASLWVNDKADAGRQSVRPLTQDDMFHWTWIDGIKGLAASRSRNDLFAVARQLVDRS